MMMLLKDLPSTYGGIVAQQATPGGKNSAPSAGKPSSDDRKATITGQSDSRLGDGFQNLFIATGPNKSEAPSDAASMYTGGTGGNTRMERKKREI